jgi:small conductance mechanosensitive channel
MKFISKYLQSIDKEKIVNIFVNIVFAIIIFLFFYTIAKISFNKIKKINLNRELSEDRELNNLQIPRPNQQDNRNFSQLHRKFLAQFVFYILVLIGIIFAFTRIGFNINTFLVILGTAGIGLAFGFQNLIQQIISGIIILLLRYFNLGDLIKVRTNIGYVKRFNLLNTTIITNDGEIIIIPNNLITTESFTNYTKNDKIYISIKVSISSNNRINFPELLQKLREQVKLSHFIINKNDVLSEIYDMSGIGTTLVVRAKIESSNYFSAQSNIRLIIRQTLEDEEVKLLDNYYLL